MAPRLKAPAQAVPQTMMEAEALAVELGDTMRELDDIQSNLAAAIARLQLASKVSTDPLGKAIDAKFKALMAFATARRGELLDGKRKSLSIAAGTIGWRRGNPKIDIEAEMEDAVMTWLEDNAPHLLVETVTINRSGLLVDRETAALVPHLSINQTESFFFKPLAVDLEKAKTSGKVPAEAEAA